MSNLLIPDFKTYTGPLTTLKGTHPLFPGLPEEYDGMPVIPAIASSTEQDLHEDTMALTALQDMSEVPVGTSVWLNHDYTLPGSYFGRSIVTPIIVQQNGIADLHTAYAVYIKEDGAARTYTQIQDGAHHGVSGGFIVTEYAFNGDPDDWWAPIIIVHVKKLEDSIVGIPANQRSWVENAIKGLFERCVRDDNGEEALRLAPAYKGLFTHDFQELTKSLQSQGLRKDLEARPTRPGTRDRVLWNPLKKHFIFQHGSRQTTVTIEEAPARLKSIQLESAKLRQKHDPTQNTPTTPPQVNDELHEQTTPPASQEETPVEEETLAGAAPTHEELLRRQWQLSQYNELGAKLGFAPVGMEEQQTHQPGANPAMTQDVFNAMMVKAWDFVLSTKAGKEFSTENEAFIQAIHDAIIGLVGTVYCHMAIDAEDENDDAEAEPQENENDGGDNEESDKHTPALHQTYVDFSSLTETIKGMATTIAEAFKGLNIKGLSTSVEGLQQAALDLQQQFAQAQAQVNAVNADVRKLKNMPLGKPTNIQRTVEPTEEPEATYEDMLSVNQVPTGVTTLKEALTQTTVKPFKMLNGSVIQVRHWPAEVGKDVRPPLTTNQKMYMNLAQQHQYTSGAECLVPCIDDPTGETDEGR